MIVNLALLVLVVAGCATLAVILIGRSFAGGRIERDLDGWRARPSSRRLVPRPAPDARARRAAA